RRSSMSQTRWTKRVVGVVMGGLLFGMGALWGSGALPLVPSVMAEVIEGEQPKAFLAGSERSEFVLREIAGIMRDDIVIPLKQIEARLARIEAIAEGPAPQRGKRTNGGSK